MAKHEKSEPPTPRRTYGKEFPAKKLPEIAKMVKGKKGKVKKPKKGGAGGFSIF